MNKEIHEECGVFGIYRRDRKNTDIARTVYYGLTALQHRGQESACIAVNKSRDIVCYKDLGLVSQVFDERNLASLGEGGMSIGHVRYSTSTCVEKAFEIWEQTKEQKSTQLIFCDLSTPKGDGTFNVYEDIRNKLTEKGVPPEEIAFIHEANTELRKAELFGKVRSGQVRFLLGSTQKLGAGTNVRATCCRTNSNVG